jgi:carbamoyl-phosphate synthase large subunit
MSVGFTLPKKNICLTIGRIEDKAAFLPSARKLVKLGFELFATEGTTQFLRENNLRVTLVHKAHSGKKPNIIDFLIEKKFGLVIDIPKTYAREEITDGYLIRRRAVDSNIPLITNLQIARVLVDAMERYSLSTLSPNPWSNYVRG